MLKEDPQMKQRIRLFALVLFAAWAVSLAAAATLTTQERAKIHPDFQSLLAKTYPDLQGVGGSIARLAKVPGGTDTYHAIIYTDNAAAVQATGAVINSTYPGFVTAQVTPAQILSLSQIDAVRYIDEGSINYPMNDVSVPETGASLVQGGFLKNTQYRGAGAIVLIYDTGIDWKHRDFRSPTDSTKSRILAIWDQTLTPGLGESSPSGFGYGVEYTQAQINAELGASPPGFVRERDINGHGTHVAGTAAGNDAPLFNKFSGMAPDADIVVVKGGDGSFTESFMVDGLTYAQNKAVQFSKPVVVNWSIGGQVGPHDGSRAYETAVNSFVATPGRVVSIAAGNDGGSLIHIGGNAGSITSITFTVPAYTPSAGTGSNQFLFDLWLNSNTNVSVSAMAPDGYTASAAYSATGSTGNGSSNADGVFSVYNSPSYTSDGAWDVQLWVRDDGVNFPKAGTWTLNVTNPGASVRYDGWLALKTVGSGIVTLNSGDANETLTMPGTAAGAITAAAYVTKWSWPVYANLQYVYNGTDRTANIASFSAAGPTRDGRTKPDIAAPGQGIASALSSFLDTTGLASIIYPGQKHFVDQGTSMATPHVTGASALILGAFPTASAASIKTLFTSGSVRDAFTGSVPNNTWGYGKLDVLEAMAKQISSSAVVTRNQYAYDGTAGNALLTLTGTTKYAVRISPTVSGQLTGITLNVTTPNNNPIQGTGNIIIEAYTNASGLPGTKMGSSVLFPLTRLNAGTPNYIQMLGAGVSVTSGVDFHIVVSIANPSETLLFRTESAAGTHSSTYSGSSWSAVTASNHRIRAIVTTATGLTSVGPASAGVPIAFDLEQNYPNPFNPTTRIGYTVGDRGLVTLEVFDLLGRNVATLVNETQAAGSYQITWNGRNGANMPVTSGVYFYRLKSGGLTKTNRMVLLK
jgi:minor extracellular serine protease Vpr